MVSHNNVDLVGKRFGALVALRRGGKAGRTQLWVCRCDCGKQVEKRGDRLRQDRVKTCGLDGHSWWDHMPPTLRSKNKSEFNSWEKMKARCYDPKHDRYKNYGGRGIVVCPQWKDSFEQFFADMGRKPTPAHTLERNDVNGNYEPSNCRWATRKEQGRNLVRSVYVEYDGKRMLLMDVVEQLGLNRMVVYGRIKNGWTLAEALSIPVRPKKKKQK